VVSDQLFVGGHDRLAGCKGLPDPRTRRLEAADQFHDDVHVRAEDVVGMLGPRDVARDPRRALPGDIPIEDVGEPHTGRRLLGQDPGDGLANGAEAEERNARWSRRGPGPLRDHRWNLELCGTAAGSVKFMVIYRTITIGDGLTAARDPCDTHRQCSGPRPPP
jgi:hypothetical protein